MSNIKFTIETVKKMYKMYQNDKTQKEIALLFKTTQDRISALFKKYKLKCSSTNSKYHNKGLRKNYFERINSIDKAYFLGFILAKGKIKKHPYRRISISVNIKDRNILEILRLYTKSNNKIKDYENNKTKKKYSSFEIRSIDWINYLKKYNIIELKNNYNNYNLPILSNEIMPHIIRGIFDGIGYFSEVNHCFVLCGQKMLLEDIRNYLIEKLHVNLKELTKKNKKYILSCANFNDFSKICAYIYDNKKDCYIIRKYYSFIKIMEYFIKRPFRLPAKLIRVRQFTMKGEFIKEYENSIECSKKTGILNQYILKCCKKEMNSCKGFVFRFNLNDYFSLVPEKYHKKSIAFSSEK